MPGRVVTRTSNGPQLASKSSTQTLASRRTTASRISSPAIVIPDEGPSSSLRTQICSAFGDAQKTTAGHRKLVVSLRKIQEACCYEPANSKSKSAVDFGEDEFNVELARCIIRLVGVKKGEGVGDRIVKYLGLFLKHASDKGKRFKVQYTLKTTVDDIQIFRFFQKAPWKRRNHFQRHLPRASWHTSYRSCYP